LRVTWRLRLLLVAALTLAPLAHAADTQAPAPPPASTPPAPRPAQAESCVTCHLDTGDPRLVTPVKNFADDIHNAKGLGCVACHGGDAHAEGMEAMDPARGFMGKPTRPQVQVICGRCHSDAQFMKRYNPALRVDQVTEYQSSTHGRRLRELNDPKVAVCTSCHVPHSIQPPSDPRSTVHPLHVAETCGRCHADAAYMAPYRIPTDQLAKYRTSVHAAAMAKGDLSSPTCNDCHGNHGAAPPGVAWVGNVCGQCHSVQGELFGKSRHAKAFVDMGTPGCATCHSNHDIKAPGDAMIGLGENAVCATCHTANDAGGKSATEMRALIGKLSTEHERARQLLGRAEQSGMEVSQAQFDLNAAKDALVKARAAIHGFTVAGVRAETDPGLAVAAKAQERGTRALDELRFRRRGLGVSAVIVLALIAGLVLKIRDVDRRMPPEARHE
jgi:cytochrome c3-like protein/cytochrome c554/c'-like protein